MTEKLRLKQFFTDKVLVQPGISPTFMDLVRALLKLSGGIRARQTPSVEKLVQRIGPSQHYVLVLVDGMGAELLNAHCPNGFLASNAKSTLTAVFPSTTAAALTTLATGTWPARHAAMGWWLYLHEDHRSITTLTFTERNTDTPLSAFGIDINRVLPVASVWPRLQRDVCSVIPAGINGSAYSTYAAGSTPTLGYKSMQEALRAAITRTKSCLTPSLTYLYLPQLDTMMHAEGPGSPQVAALLTQIDSELADMVARIDGRARVVITADHGQITVPVDRSYCLAADDPLAARLICQPSGEPRVPYFHVRSGEETAFRDLFLERFSDDFALLLPEETESLHLFGPAKIGRVARPRLGTYVGIPLRNAKLHVQPVGDSLHNRGAHGGLSKQEMLVPLVVV